MVQYTFQIAMTYRDIAREADTENPKPIFSQTLKF